MHILTGLLLGELLLGAGALRRRAGAPPFVLEHVVPGRVRFRVAAAKGDTALAERIMTAVSKAAGVHQVRVDARSGSVVVLFHDTPDSRREVVAALQEVLPQPERPAAEAGDDTTPTLRRRIHALGRSVDQAVVAESHGVTDLKTLLGFAASAWGVKTLIAPGAGSRFTGLTLLFWSYNLLK